MSAARLSISIALATYNGEKYLRTQLDSLASQTLLPDELVICDDCSNDRTLEIAREFARAAPFPVVIHLNPQNLGWRGNFMAAADKCSSDLIAFCDQDDVWYPHKLALMRPAFDDVEVLLAYHDADLVDADGKVYGNVRAGERDARTIERLQTPTTWSNPLGLTLVFRRSLLQLSAYWKFSADSYKPGERAAHDQWFYKLATNLGRVRFFEHRLLAYRQHGGNSVGFVVGDPQSWQQRIAASRPRPSYISMMAGFIQALEVAQAEGKTEFGRQLAEAIIYNRQLLTRMEARAALAEDSPTFFARFGMFTRLLASGAYTGPDDWKLGRRAMLADLLSTFLPSSAGALPMRKL